MYESLVREQANTVSKYHKKIFCNFGKKHQHIITCNVQQIRGCIRKYREGYMIQVDETHCENH